MGLILSQTTTLRFCSSEAIFFLAPLEFAKHGQAKAIASTNLNAMVTALSTTTKLGRPKASQL